jgi:hypothetical protein
VICKDPNYFWRLYTVCPNDSPFSIIKTNSYEHICVKEIVRSDYAQLTVKMIATAIKRDLVEDMNATIKGIRTILSPKFPCVTPSYSKV